jgi:hypothetical protein
MAEMNAEPKKRSANLEIAMWLELAADDVAVR